MRVLGNLIWFILIGFISCLLWGLVGMLFCITLIGIPFGLQCFKIAGLVILPFGRNVTINFDAHPIANFIWLLFFGIFFAMGYVIIGILICLTIIGVPFGLQCFKLAKLSLLPFGASY